MRRRRRLFLILLALLAISVGAFLWPVDRGPFTRGTYDRIQNGMTLCDVQSLLGLEPSETISLRSGEPTILANGTRAAEFVRWQNGNKSIVIALDESGAVQGKNCFLDTTIERARIWWAATFSKAAPF